MIRLQFTMKISLMHHSIDFISNHIMKDRFFPKYMIYKYEPDTFWVNAPGNFIIYHKYTGKLFIIHSLYLYMLTAKFYT